MKSMIGCCRVALAGVVLFAHAGCGNGGTTGNSDDDYGGSIACPAGTFTETCSDVVCHAGRIDATCLSQSQESVDTSLETPCDEEVSNCNGELTCGSCPVPSGNYAETCTDCSASSELLTCLLCREEGNAGYASSSLQLPCDDNISNCDGQLTCGSCP
jgi:hypothetical protein